MEPPCIQYAYHKVIGTLPDSQDIGVKLVWELGDLLLISILISVCEPFSV